MDSLKQETQGLQKEKEVRFLYWLTYILVAFFFNLEDRFYSNIKK